MLLSSKTVPGGILAFHNAYFPRPPEEFYRLASNYRYAIVPTPQGLLVARV